MKRRFALLSLLASLLCAALPVHAEPGAAMAYFTHSFGKLPARMTHRTVVKRIEPVGDMFATDSAVFIEVPDGVGGKRVAREFFTFGLMRPKGSDWEFVVVRATPLAAPAANRGLSD